MAPNNSNSTGGSNEWTVLNKAVPLIPSELPREKIADLLRTTSNSLQSASNNPFETKTIERPGDGVAFVARVTDPVAADGWGWLDDEAAASHVLVDGAILTEATRALGFNTGDKFAVISRKRYSLSSAPDLQFVHYLRIKENAQKIPVTKEAIKVEPSNLKHKKPVSSRNDDEVWGFEDQSVPSLVSLARYKRNHDFINELLSPQPIPPREKFESKVTLDDIHKLEAEIKLLEEQNKKLWSSTNIGPLAANLDQ
ncbi:hypothetical protein HDU79_002365 [Rhizoclosmatium sp. JEL0117]|nr:hypothetical protein HDU79_002365 [Rhizoclosmatium sp. JEL0117]